MTNLSGQAPNVIEIFGEQIEPRRAACQLECCYFAGSTERVVESHDDLVVDPVVSESRRIR